MRQNPCPDLDIYARFADHLADEVRPIMNRHFRSLPGVEVKEDASPVTIADKAVEEKLRQLITASWPDHGILGEEYGGERLESDFVWVLDPIDGTRAFMTGNPLFGSLISLTFQGKPVVGIIEAAALGERWLGVAGQPTLFNGKTVTARTTRQLGDAFFYTTTPDMFKGAELEAFRHVAGLCRFYSFGGDCYNYGLIASGHIDLVVENSLKAHDFCALVPVIEGAGGIMRDWQGQELTLRSDGHVIAAASMELYKEARLALLEKTA